MTAEQVVNDYLAAYTSGHVDAAAALVTNDFSFQGPIQATVGRDALRNMVAHVAESARGCRILRQWRDGDEVCSLYEFDVETAAGTTTVLVSEWDTVRGDQIASSLMVFDTGPFRAAPTAPAGAVDPVCGMSVDPTSAAAVRRHRDRDYYFCAQTCADRFDADPERYIADSPAA